MTEKDDDIYIKHMLDSILRIYEYVESKDQFYHTQLVQDAVMRNLQVMAESSQRISAEIKKQYPEIPWKNISGFRNILVHDYLGVDLDVIWSVVDQELHPLELVLTEMMLP